MVGLFKRIFGGPTTDDLRKDKNTQEYSSDQSKSDTDYSRVTDHSIPGAPYFEQLENLTSSISARNYPEAAKAARASLPLVRIWLDIRRDDGKPLGISIPALSQGGTMMAITADKDGLSELRKLVQDFHHLEAYRGEVEEHFVDLDLFNQIRKIVRQSPGVLQNRVKGELGVNDGRRASRLVSYLEKSGELIRAKSGKSYKLFLADVKLPGDALAAIYSEPKSPGSHRQNSHAAIPRELNPKTATVVPLPPSPNSWEQPVILPITQDDFADPEGAWNEIAVETIGRTDRPDPAFRKHFSTSNGALSFDDLAKSEASSGAPGAVMFSNMRGETKALAPLRRDAYGISVHPEGNGFAVRSKSNVLTIYNEHLEVDFETDLEQVPEVTENRNRLRMTGSEGHREVRCVALTPKRDRYLFTHIDEAWCVSRDGELLWGLRMPANEPPRIRVGVPGFGTAREIEEALQVMGLKMPVTPNEIRLRYRKLALKLHPDLNPGSDEQMKELNLASERLTGLDADQLTGTGRESESFELVINFGLAAQADWIYAAAFSGTGDTSLLGTYAGRVIRVDRKGLPLAIYDVGSTPARIIETKTYLYIMTFTRLYVIKGDQLVALEDCPPKCDLLVSGGMVLLVERKGVRVFTDSGRPLGIALTKAPIRRVYVIEGDLIIETRTQRARFRGLHPTSGISIRS